MQSKTTRDAKPNQSAALVVGLGVLAMAACGSKDADVSGSKQALAAQCAPAQITESDPWICGQNRSVECTRGDGTADPRTLYVKDTADDVCSDQTELTLNDSGPFAVGTHSITVTGDEGATLCSSTLTVTDTQAPKVEAKTLFLWPPNHKMHSIGVDDCFAVSDSCQSHLQGQFVWASSDEPVDDLGDGHFGPDIMIDDCNHVQVRAERQGPKDGRVYKLGMRVVDGSGNATESVCTVIVDHDQRGVDGADSGESYRLTLDGTNGQISCNGENPVPPPSAGGDGDGAGNADGGVPTEPAGDGDSSADAGVPTEPANPI